MSTTSYLNTTEAQVYFDELLYTEAWDLALESNRLKALKQATRIINRLRYKGDKTSDTQENEFPRGEDTDVPEDIEWACCYIALALLDGKNTELDAENLALVSQGFSSVRSTYDKDTMLPHIVAGVPSAEAWKYLKPYLLDATEITLNRAT
jgi:hypothetical protein